MVSLWNQNETYKTGLNMSTTITLKGIPENVYLQLKSSAETNRRSINSEAIACLETVLLPRKTSAIAHASKAQTVRQALNGQQFQPEDIDQFKRTGRT
jgi:hypothetical protein